MGAPSEDKSRDSARAVDTEGRTTTERPGSGRQPIRVVVAVPTYRRSEQLAALHSSLVDACAELPDRYAPRILFVDNDPQGSAVSTVQALAADASVPTEVVHEPRPGISHARNAALSAGVESGDRLLAFIDDDERPAPGWLSCLVETWARCGEPAAVSGRVVADYLGEVDPFIEAGRFFVRRQLPTDSAIDVFACGNLLLDLHAVSRAGVTFDVDFGLTGGEDTLFSKHLLAAGERAVWCNESVAVDQVPVDRLTRRWVLARAYSHGTTSASVDLALTPGKTSSPQLALGRARGIAGGVARVGVGAARYAFGIATRNKVHQARGARLAARGAGLAVGYTGHNHAEYAR